MSAKVYIAELWCNYEPCDQIAYSTRELAEQQVERWKADPRTRGTRHSPNGFNVTELEVLDKL